MSFGKNFDSNPNLEFFFQRMEDSKAKILDEKKNSDSFVVIGQILHDMYYKDKCMTSQKEFLSWTKAQLGFSKSTTYEYIISWKIYSELEEKLMGKIYKK